LKDIDAEKKIAVLIDAENAQYSVLGAVLSELSKHGHIVVKKAYGDWSSSHLRNGCGLNLIHLLFNAEPLL
jgi:hypothetical protein